MKKIIYTITLLVATLSFAQNNLNPSLFIGTWEHQENNKIFRLIIHIEPANDRIEYDNLQGNYELLEVINGIETLITKSNRRLITTGGDGYDGFWWNSLKGSTNSIKMYGRITDNSYDYDNDYSFVSKLGHFTFDIQSGCLGCPTTAHWVVTNMYSQNTLVFNIPTDVILTKIN